MAALLPYQRLNDDRWLNVSIEKNTATPLGDGKGGSKRLRLCFKDLEDPAYRIALTTRCGCCLAPQNKNNSCSFTVLCEGKPKVVSLNKKSLKHRLKISERLLEKGVLEDNLMRLVCVKFFQNDFSLARQYVTQGHFSAKDYGLDGSIYIGDGITAMGIKKSLIEKGGFAKVKKAVTSEGEALARRICALDNKHKQIILKSVETMKRLCGRTGLIDLRGIVSYRSLKGENKIVTFHRLYPTDLFKRLNAKLAIPFETKIAFARQLFTALRSLDGAHGDLKPENILIDGDQLVLTDFDFYRSKGETKPHFLESYKWAPPEALLEKNIVVEKLDVWAAGLILFYLFTNGTPYIRIFPWQLKNYGSNAFTLFPQKTIDSMIEDAPLSPLMKELVSNMVVINVANRWTVEEADCYFQEKFGISN